MITESVLSEIHELSALVCKLRGLSAGSELGVKAAIVGAEERRGGEV